jgi:hypothetical protein
LPNYQKPTYKSSASAFKKNNATPKKADWKPNSIVDKTLESGFKKLIHKSRDYPRSKTVDPETKKLEKDEADAVKSVKAEDIEKITKRLYLATE